MFHGLAGRHAGAELLFPLAQHGSDSPTGAIIGLSVDTAAFLYSASCDRKRNLTASQP